MVHEQDDEFFFEDVDPSDEEDIPSNVPQEIQPPEKKAKKEEPPVHISNRDRREPDPSMLSRQKLEKLYTRVSQFLSPEQRRYTKKVINGTIGVDTKYEMEILIRQMSLLISEAMPVFIDERRVSRDLAATVDSFRQCLRDLRDFEKEDREAESQEKNVNALTVAEQQKEVNKLDVLLGASGDLQA